LSLTQEEKKIEDEALEFARKHKKAIAKRLTDPEHFIEQYFAARNVVNKLKDKFRSKIKVDLLLKNTDNSHRAYKAGIDRIDNHVPEKYTPAALAKMLGIG
jgi:UDP-N-acetylglucosamine kinase